MAEQPRDPDPRVRAAEYRAARDGEADASAGAAPGSEPASAAPRASTAGSSAAERAAVIETAIQQAMRRGDFDDLPGAGKPIPGLGGHHDPDWWIRRKIQTEQLEGLGPPALTLRVEHARMTEHLDALHREHDVREYLEDFNRRIRLARMQLQGGPPVVTPERDIEAEVAAWAERRRARANEKAIAEASAPPPARRRRWGRRR